MMSRSQRRGMTYGDKLKVTLRLTTRERDASSKSLGPIIDVKEQEVYLCDLPLMTDRGSFIFNGTERIVVSQLHRAPGVLFQHDL